MIMAKGLPPLRQNLPKNLAAPPTPRHMIERLTLGDVVYLHHQALEKMAKSLELHCQYEEFGCPEIIPYHTKLMHEDSCNFRPYSCPWYGCPCSAVGDIPLLVSHLTDYHKAVMLYGCKFLFLTRQSSEGVTVLETLECWSFERSQESELGTDSSCFLLEMKFAFVFCCFWYITLLS